MKTVNLDYEKSLQRAKNIYSKIGRIVSPALDNQTIIFSDIGFNHLVRKGRTLRTKNEQKKRFFVVPAINFNVDRD